MIDAKKIQVGDKVKLITDNWDDCQEFAQRGNVYTVVPKDNLAEEFFTKDTVEVDIFSYFDNHCEDFELVESTVEPKFSMPKIKVLTGNYEYQGLYKDSIHTVSRLVGDGFLFKHNGRIWTLSTNQCEIVREGHDVINTPKKATDFLSKALSLLEERGKDYDQPEGERSMGKTVTAFNAITGHDLKESDGWLILQLLKDVRQNQNRDSYHADSAEDCISYAALKAEALAEGK